MGLPHDEWLHIAKRLPVGQKQRYFHRREKRNNLIVANLPDRWTCYCQSCKEGGVVMKEHVMLTTQEPAESRSLVMPTDMVKVLDADPHIRDGVLGFIASKNMDAMYLPELWFSSARKRILVNTPNAGWLGRDTTGKSMQKWLTYNAGTFVGLYDGEIPHPNAVVVEDTFSYYKVRWALQGFPFSVYCSLGTAIDGHLMVRLLTYKQVFMFYDGDKAGYKGAASESMRLRSCGIDAFSACATAGMDPKDMGVLAIRNHLGVYNASDQTTA